MFSIPNFDANDNRLEAKFNKKHNLKVPWHDLFFFHNKFAFGIYAHVHSVVLNVWSMKYSQNTKFTLKIHALDPQINPCYG